MGNKTNLVTLRKSLTNFNLSRNNYTEFIYGFFFLSHFKSLLTKNNVFLVHSILNFVSHKVFYSFQLYFRVSKILTLKRKLLLKKKKFNKNYFFSKKKKKLILKVPLITLGKDLKKKSLPKKKSIFRGFLFKNTTKIVANIQLKRTYKTLYNFFSLFFFLKKKIIFFKCRVLNILLRKRLVYKLFFEFRKSADYLFPRRFNFFLDFLKLSTLFTRKLVLCSFYIKLIVEIFRILQKKRHGPFISFLKKFFNFLLANSPLLQGIKFSISGKLKGKQRSNWHSFTLGRVPIQSLHAQIDFAKAHCYTLTGVFGLKLWVFF